MKLSSILLAFLPAAFAAEAQQVPSALNATPSLPNVTPPTPLPALQSGSRSTEEDNQLAQVAMDANTLPDPIADAAGVIATNVPAEPSTRFIRLKSRGGARGTKTHQVRSEGSLGQTPWIGMAIGLTCTTLAAVMLG